MPSESDERIRELFEELVEVSAEDSTSEHGGWSVLRTGPEGWAIFLYAKPDEPTKALSICRSFLKALLTIGERTLAEEKLNSVASMVLTVLGAASHGPNDLMMEMFRGPIRKAD